MFSETLNELKSLKAWWTIPMPCAIASSGERKCTSVAAQPDRPFVRPLQAVEDRHQRRLAGAVLAHHGMDLAASDGEIHVIVRDERAVALDDAGGLQLQRRHVERPYFAIIGSSILIAPLTIWSRSSFTFAMASG